jgi:hypothetical protein
VIAPIALLIAAVSGVVVWRRRHDRQARPAHAVIVSPRKSTSIAHDGAVRSAQSAELTLDPEDLERIWTAANLENLARTYWRFLSRVTLGLIRVVYGQDTRSVALFGKLPLLRFDGPEYLIEDSHGAVRWQIRDGLLVARTGRGCGYLSLDVLRLGLDEDGRAKLLIEVEVSNFYPSIAVGFSTPVYEMTQSALHAFVTNNFLRSLAKLDLAQSKIGHLRAESPAGSDADPEGAHLGPVVPGGDPAHRA